MPIYHYLAYGLNIASDIECPELLPGNGAPDVCVHYGRVPERLENPSMQGVLYQVTPDQFLLAIEHIGRYLAANGNEIVIDRAQEADDSDIRTFLFSSVFGALLYQRGFLPLHASAIDTCHGAVAFAGPSGYGKSTLAAVFYQRGYRVLTDDICAISLDEQGIPIVTPAYAQLNLWADTLKQIAEPKECLRRTRRHLEKYRLSLHLFSASPAALHCL